MDLGVEGWGTGRQLLGSGSPPPPVLESGSDFSRREELGPHTGIEAALLEDEQVSHQATSVE